MSRQKASKRHVFSELMEGVDAMKAHREGKLTLRTHVLAVPEIKETPGGDFFVSVRESFNVSRPVWASMLRVSPRTVEKWEQGGQASPLAATFVELVSRYPDTIDRLQTLPKSVSRSRKRIIDQSPKALRSSSTVPATALLSRLNCARHTVRRRYVYCSSVKHLRPAEPSSTRGIARCFASLRKPSNRIWGTLPISCRHSRSMDISSTI
jgi:putative transcriptional regulator